MLPITCLVRPTRHMIQPCINGCIFYTASHLLFVFPLPVYDPCYHFVIQLRIFNFRQFLIPIGFEAYRQTSYVLIPYGLSTLSLRTYTYFLLALFSLFALRFSFIVFAGFFLAAFFESCPLAINLSFNFVDKILDV